MNRDEAKIKAMQNWGSRWDMVSEPIQQAFIDAQLFQEIRLLAKAGFIKDDELRDYIRSLD